MSVYELDSSYDSLHSGFIDQSRMTLAAGGRRVFHCLDQMEEDDLWWRPQASMNAAGNIVLHLCGNVGQWLIAGVGGGAYVRDRPAEFEQREPVSKSELARRLRDTLGRADAAIAVQDERSLLERRPIQGYQTTRLAAILHALTHFEGHAQEIIYITRLRLGDRYRFLWVPSTPEQISAGEG